MRNRNVSGSIGRDSSDFAFAIKLPILSESRVKSAPVTFWIVRGAASLYAVGAHANVKRTDPFAVS
jgi:hypothetical protein